MTRCNRACAQRSGSGRSGGALIVTDCDGQMFKFGPLIGERIAAMFDGQQTIDSLAHWAADW